MRKLQRILMYHVNDVCYNSLNEFTDLLALCLKKKGIDVGFVNLDQDGDKIISDYSRELDIGFDAAISFNSRGQEHVFVKEDNLFEHFHVPYFNWIVDHPCEHLLKVKNPIKDSHIVCVDRDHESYVRKYYSDIGGVHFVPIGGLGTGDDSLKSKENFEKRRFNVIFTGSHVDLNEYVDEIRNLPDKLPDVSVNLIECMLDDRKISTENALIKVLKDMNIETNIDLFKYYMFMITPASFYLRAYVREEIIRYIAESGIQIDLWGIGWDKLESLGNITYHGAVSYAESVKLCEEAKISLNVMPLFRNGLHDRIPTALLHGSAVLSVTSGFFEDIFDAGRDLLIYDATHPELIASLITASIEDTDNLFQIACRGMDKAKDLLSWDKRAEEIIDIIEKCYNE